MRAKKDIKPAKVCFQHIGGKLGILLMEKFIEDGWIAKSDPTQKHFFITDKGKQEFTNLGIDISKIESEAI